MSLSKSIVGNIEGFSVAMYSSWAYYRPERIMFDAGEGVSMTMRNFVFGVEKVFISHGHHDHIGGIAGMVGSRSAARGDKNKPLEIYFPDGWDNISALREYVGKAYDRLSYELKWIPISIGGQVPLSGEGQVSRFVRAIEADHTRNLALGFQVIEERHRLKNEFVGMPGIEIGMLRKKNGNGHVMEKYHHVCLTYSGDTSPIDPILVEDSEVLMHEATFVNPEDIDRNGHSSVDGAVRVAAEAKVKALVLYHLSVRYATREAVDATVKAIKDHGFKGSVHFMDGSRMIKITEGEV